MKANELRVGNYYDCNGEVKQATPSTIEDVWHGERVWVRPIPLTEDWLKKLGAEKFPGGGFILKNHHITWAECRSKFIHATTAVELTYVHQLQNLYFALTSEELQRK